jgi:hypothetical protein
MDQFAPQHTRMAWDAVIGHQNLRDESGNNQYTKPGGSKHILLLGG